MTPLFNIVEAILDQGGEHVADGILALGNSLALKCSPYLHIMIFKLLKKFLIERRDDSMAKSKLYMRILIENKTLQNILYLMNQTNCLDLKAMCIKFLNVILTYPANVIIVIIKNNILAISRARHCPIYFQNHLDLDPNRR